MRAVAEGRLPEDDSAFHKHIDQCLGCRACEPVCPSGVEYGFLLERARATLARAAGLSFPTRALLYAFGRDLPRRIVGLGSRIARASGIPSLLARLPARYARVRFASAMLAGSKPWRPLGRGRSSGARGQPPARSPHPPLKAAMLDGCVQEELFARVNRATRAVLKRNQCKVVNARNQGCCGALHAHTGALDEARELARRNIAAFEGSGADVIVVNAAGCGSMMKEYGELLGDDPEWHSRAVAVAAKVKDVSEFLASRGPSVGAPLDITVTYDAPCHLIHAQRITHAPLDVLRAIPNLRLVPLPRSEECCGGAGIYGLLHEDLGGRILRDKVDAVTGTGADVVVTPNPGCMMQIGAGLVMRGSTIGVLHPVELLAESYRRQS